MIKRHLIGVNSDIFCYLAMCHMRFLFSVNLSQSAFWKFHLGLGNVGVIGMVRPMVIRTGLCWLLGKGPRICRCDCNGVLFLSFVTKVRSGEYSFCHRAEWKVPFSLGS